MMHFNKVVAVAALGLGLSAFAQAAVYDLGTLNSGETLFKKDVSIEVTERDGNQQYYFDDRYTFSIENGLESASFGVFSIDLSFSTTNIKIEELWVNVYWNDGSGVPNNDFRLFQLSGSLGAPDVHGKQTLQVTGDLNFAQYAYSGNYILRLTGAVDANSGWGAYDLSLTGGPLAVPEPAEYAMLLAGLGVVGMVARRRRLKV
ncbi:MAG: FxDxF family PEP-CTERM protein [Azoarcus sp.]|jgi:hypothetical protein|nr:FxDxF family PEP-CTERM protein [Azoarcus sp.]